MKPSEELTYSNTFEGLRLALTRHGLAQKDVDAAFRSIGVDFAKLLPGYPKDTFVRALHVSAKLAFPDLGSEPAFREVGRLVLEGYVETVVGRAVYAAARLMGPLWTLKRMARNFRTADNCTEARVDERGPSEVSMWLNDHLDCHGYYEGLFETIVRLAGGKAASVQLEKTQGRREVVYRIRWEKG